MSRGTRANRGFKFPGRGWSASRGFRVRCTRFRNPTPSSLSLSLSLGLSLSISLSLSLSLSTSLSLHLSLSLSLSLLRYSVFLRSLRRTALARLRVSGCVTN